ncbi:MAG: polysaccharide deacetylase family protein [Clostridia bacterium]|nr:polysaccharide deacetylase family protein [Clostridia bacterium]
MKRFICFVLSCLMITSSLCIFPLAQGNDSADAIATEASFELAYGGANGIFSMTFDDGDVATTKWLNEVFERYNLYGSTFNIPYKNFATEELEETWREILAKGRLESESHSMTHKPLPAQWWSNYSKYEANNTEANYQYEIVDAYNRILEVTGRAPLAFAPSNNTLHDDAVKVVQQYHYVMRQGLRWNIEKGKWQSLDPIVNATYNSHETSNSAAGAGGWYNPYMMSFASNPIKDGLDVAANEGA